MKTLAKRPLNFQSVWGLLQFDTNLEIVPLNVTTQSILFFKDFQLLLTGGNLN